MFHWWSSWKCQWPLADGPFPNSLREQISTCQSGTQKDPRICCKSSRIPLDSSATKVWGNQSPKVPLLANLEPSECASSNILQTSYSYCIQHGTWPVRLKQNFLGPLHRLSYFISPNSHKSSSIRSSQGASPGARARNLWIWNWDKCYSPKPNSVPPWDAGTAPAPHPAQGLHSWSWKTSEIDLYSSPFHIFSFVVGQRWTPNGAETSAYEYNIPLSIHLGDWVQWRCPTKCRLMPQPIGAVCILPQALTPHCCQPRISRWTLDIQGP